MKRIIIFMFKLLVLVLLTFSCTSNKENSPEDLIRQTLKKRIDLNMFEWLYQQDKQVKLSVVRDTYDFISLVYLKDGCEPCIPKYIEWHNKLEAMDVPDNYTVVFIIEGNSQSSYENFMAEARKQDAFNERFYTVFDTGYFFWEGNQDIPFHLIESSLLIDDKNRVKLIGSPYVSPGMTELFLNTVQNK